MCFGGETNGGQATILGALTQPPQQNPYQQGYPGTTGGPPGYAPPMPPAPTSAAATASLVLAILGSMCLGPIGGLAAVLVGLVAIWDIRSSQGRKGGGVIAWVGVAIGGFTTLAYAALVVVLVVSARGATAPTPPMPPPTAYAPPTATRPSAPPAPGGGIPFSREEATTETKVGTVTVVDVGLDEVSLEAVLRKQRAETQHSGQTLVVETTSSGCRPCLGVAAALTDPAMQKALDGVRLVRVDVNDFQDELPDLGIPGQLIPGFYLLGTNLSPRDGVTGGEWDDDTAANVAPVLEAFVRGTYTRRRESFKAPPVAKPRGTIL